MPVVTQEKYIKNQLSLFVQLQVRNKRWSKGLKQGLNISEIKQHTEELITYCMNSRRDRLELYFAEVLDHVDSDIEDFFKMKKTKDQ